MSYLVHFAFASFTLGTHILAWILPALLLSDYGTFMGFPLWFLGSLIGSFCIVFVNFFIEYMVKGSKGC